MVLQWEKTVTVRFRDTNYSSQDRENSWYTEHDLASFKQERQQLKKLVRKLGSIECLESTLGHDEVSCRGLEIYVSRQKSTRRRERIQLALHIVCTTQESAAAADVNSHESTDELIASKYRKISQPCQREANTRAFLDMSKENVAEKQQQWATPILTPTKPSTSTSTSTTSLKPDVESSTSARLPERPQWTASTDATMARRQRC